MKVEKKILVEAIKKHIPLADDHYAEYMADRVINEGDDRLAQNLNEWIQGGPISDLWIGEYCINAIMSIRGDEDFLDALLTMSLYLRDEDAGVIKIWRAKL